MADVAASPGARQLLARLEGEVGRRLVHASGALVPLGYLALDHLAGVPVEWRWLQALLVFGVGVVAVLEFLRLRRGLDWWVYRHLTREYEAEKVAGYALYVVSAAIVALLFEPAIALAAILTLAIGDPVGGVLAGEDPIPVKRPRAMAGTFLVALAIGAWLLPLAAAVAAAIAATVADAVFWEVRGYVIDDNLAIPLAAATAAWLVVTFLPA